MKIKQTSVLSIGKMQYWRGKLLKNVLRPGHLHLVVLILELEALATLSNNCLDFNTYLR